MTIALNDITTKTKKADIIAAILAADYSGPRYAESDLKPMKVGDLRNLANDLAKTLTTTEETNDTTEEDTKTVTEIDTTTTTTAEDVAAAIDAMTNEGGEPEALTDSDAIEEARTNEADEAFIAEGLEAYQRIKQTAEESRDAWLKVGRALAAGRRLHKGNKAFGAWVKETAFADMPAAVRSDAIKMANEWDDIVAEFAEAGVAMGDASHPQVIIRRRRKLKDAASPEINPDAEAEAEGAGEGSEGDTEAEPSKGKMTPEEVNAWLEKVLKARESREDLEALVADMAHTWAETKAFRDFAEQYEG